MSDDFDDQLVESIAEEDSLVDDSTQSTPSTPGGGPVSDGASPPAAGTSQLSAVIMARKQRKTYSGVPNTIDSSPSTSPMGPTSSPTASSAGAGKLLPGSPNRPLTRQSSGAVAPHWSAMIKKKGGQQISPPQTTITSPREQAQQSPFSSSFEENYKNAGVVPSSASPSDPAPISAAASSPRADQSQRKGSGSREMQELPAAAEPTAPAVSSNSPAATAVAASSGSNSGGTTPVSSYHPRSRTNVRVSITPSFQLDLQFSQAALLQQQQAQDSPQTATPVSGERTPRSTAAQQSFDVESVAASHGATPTVRSVAAPGGEQAALLIFGDKTTPSFQELKLRCLAQDHRYGFLTVEQFLEFGMRYGFQSEPFINIFTTTYRGFMTPKQVVPQLSAIFDTLYKHPIMQHDSEKNKLIERVVNLLYNFVDVCLVDFMHDPQIVDEMFGFIGTLQAKAAEPASGVIGSDADQKRYERVKEFVIELCEMLAKRLSGQKVRRRVNMAENLEEFYVIDHTNDSKTLLGPASSSDLKHTSSGSRIKVEQLKAAAAASASPASPQADMPIIRAPKPSLPPKSVTDPRRLQLTQINPVELARQLTLIEFQLFRKFNSEELLSLGWMKESREWVSPNITAMISKSNLLTDWIATTLVSTKDLKERRKVLSHFVQVAYACYTMQNFNTLFSVVMGLIAQPVFRLKQTWEGLSKQDRASYKILETITEFGGNRKNYREAIKVVQEKNKLARKSNKVVDPCLPHIGVALTDLVFFDSGNADEKIVKNEVGRNEVYVNFTKRSSMSQVVKFLLECQEVEYVLEPVDIIQQFIHWQLNACTLSNENELFQLSYICEPRQSSS